MNVALISFLVNSLNTRSLSSYVKTNGFKSTCFFCPVKFNETNLSELISLLKKLDVSLVGVSTVTDDFKSAVSVTEKIKNNIDVYVIWGGAHVNVKPEECLQYADMVCMGEGEEAFLELVQNLSKKKNIVTDIQNIWFKTSGGIVRNGLRRLDEDLDRFPMPDFDLNDMYVMNDTSFEMLNETHINHEYSIMTSRGCPYSCTYCYNSYRRRQYRGKGRYLRTRKIETVIEELSIAKDTFKGLKKINFMDDSFIARKKEDFETFQKLYPDKINLPFYALAEPMAFDFEKVRILKLCGLSDLQVGIQSGSERTNQIDYKRKIANEKVLKIARFIKQMEINVVYDLIFNNPYESREDLLETIDLLLQFPTPFSLQGYNLIFFPETQLTERALKDGSISVKAANDDFSTIEGKCDSPISMRGLSEVSNRFYRINFNSKDKEYYNSVISLMAYNHVPRFIIRFFRISDKPFMLMLLRNFNRLYSFAHKCKQFLRI